MPRTARLTDALRGRGKALVSLGAAAAALAGAGTASAALASATPHHAPAVRPAAAVQHATPKHATLQVAPKHAAAVQRAARQAPAARPAARQTQKSAATPQRPYEIYDSVTPSAIPAHHQVATYATGGYAVSPSQVSGRGNVLWIDTRGTDPKAAALDVEPGDATPSVAASWAWHKLHAADNSVAIIYTMRSEWAAAKAAVDTLPAHMQSHIRWWIADPTGVPHVVPGASATQWYWGSNYDITTANPGFQ
jgi:hypothetical protein